jgi:hypothetical protein
MAGDRQAKKFLGSMTEAVRDALPVEAKSPYESFLFNLTSNRHEYWTGSEWKFISDDGYIYNSTKQRYEYWVTCAPGPAQILYNAYPARVVHEHFIGGSRIVPALLGLTMEMEWIANGRRAGGANLADTNFIPANEIGGGLDMIVVAVVSQDDDYTALHWDDNYPFTRQQSPHMHIAADFVDDTDVAYLAGMVDNTRSTGANAFALPDNGVYVRLDTDAVDGYGDANMHFVVRVGGVDVHDVDLGPAPAGVSCGTIYFSDDGDTVYFVISGTEISYTGVLPDVQMQPYAAVVARNGPVAVDKIIQLRDFWLIMDAGF